MMHTKHVYAPSPYPRAQRVRCRVNPDAAAMSTKAAAVVEQRIVHLCMHMQAPERIGKSYGDKRRDFLFAIPFFSDTIRSGN